MSMHIQEAAQKYIDQGMAVIPVKSLSKIPALSGWQNRSVGDVDITADFPEGSNSNIGIVLGSQSGGIVDIDLDCAEAVRMAPMFLPETGMIFGRAGSPRSHYVYRVENCQGRVAFSGPANEGVLVEYRGNGAQTVLPPSIHPSGEAVTFYEDGEPSSVDHDALDKAVKQLAAAALIAKHWVSGKRHDTALALSGALLSRGWFDDDVEDFVRAVCKGAGDAEVDDRVKTVAATQEAQDRGEPATGLTRLRSLIGSSVVERVVEWLELDVSDGLGHNSQNSTDVLRCSDIGNAQALVEQHRHELRYCFDLGCWLRWDGKQWKLDDKAGLERLAENTVRSFPIEATDILDRTQREEFLEWTAKSGNRNRIKAMCEQARHRMHVDHDKLDADETIINVSGTVIYLKTGDARSTKPNDFCTKTLETDYDPNAQCPQFMAFLDRIMGGSEDLIGYLQRAVGYSLSGSTREQCFFIAHGSGANGKSVFLNLVRKMSGSYGLNVPMQTLMTKSTSGSVPNDIARLRGSRLVTAMEGESNQKMAESLVKQLTGGDAMTARFLFKEYFEFIPQLKLWMATNHKPKVTGDDPAIWRRIHLIPFNVVIPPDERDGDLPTKLEAEWSGILNWAVKGAVDWFEKGLMPPAEVLSATDAYKNEMDTFSRFCSDVIVRQPGCNTPKSSAYDAYCGWQREEGGEDLSKNEFGNRMKRLGFDEKRSKGVRYWKDITLDVEDPFLAAMSD